VLFRPLLAPPPGHHRSLDQIRSLHPLDSFSQLYQHFRHIQQNTKGFTRRVGALGHSGKAVALFSIEPAPVREERTAMLRIHIHQRDGGMTFTLEARLRGPSVREVTKSWQEAIQS